MLDFYTEKKIHKRVLHFHRYEIVNNQYMHIEVLPLSKYQNRTGKKNNSKKKIIVAVTMNIVVRRNETRFCYQFYM